MAKSPARIFAATSFAADFNINEPTSTAASAISKISHSAIFEDETVPSTKPMKKKYRAIKATMASIPQKIQNRII